MGGRQAEDLKSAYGRKTLAPLDIALLWVSVALILTSSLTIWKS